MTAIWIPFLKRPRDPNAAEGTHSPKRSQHLNTPAALRTFLEPNFLKPFQKLGILQIGDPITHEKIPQPTKIIQNESFLARKPVVWESQIFKETPIWCHPTFSLLCESVPLTSLKILKIMPPAFWPRSTSHEFTAQAVRGNITLNCSHFGTKIWKAIAWNGE